MTGAGVVLVTTFLASSVEAIEMVIIVLGVGAARGWRSALIGAAAGFALLAVVIAVLNVALAAVPTRPPPAVRAPFLPPLRPPWQPQRRPPPPRPRPACLP